jgi:hypothetical protein
MGKRKLTTFIGVLLILFGVVVGVMVIDQESSFLPRARPEFIPQYVKLSNISDEGFSVSWVTEAPSVGFIKYGTSPSNLSSTNPDDRDQLTGDSGEFLTHHITITGLDPATDYYFKLGSQGRQLYDNDGEAFRITTAPPLSPPAVDNISGTVFTPAQTPAEGALVYINLPNATPLSILVNSRGSWTANLATARVRTLDQYANYDQSTSKLEIIVRNDIADATDIITTTANSRPVPPIILGQSQDYTSTAPSDESLPESKFSLAPITVTEPESDRTLAITYPARENLTLTAPQPEFRGVAPPTASSPSLCLQPPSIPPR